MNPYLISNSEVGSVTPASLSIHLDNAPPAWFWPGMLGLMALLVLGVWRRKP